MDRAKRYLSLLIWTDSTCNLSAEALANVLPQISQGSVLIPENGTNGLGVDREKHNTFAHN